MEEKRGLQWEKIHEYLSKILIGILLIVLSPIICIVLVFLYIYKNVILLYTAKFFKPKLHRLLSPQESFHATDRFWEETRGSIGLVVVLNGNVDVQIVSVS
jgi:hypothetical protein